MLDVACAIQRQYLRRNTIEEETVMTDRHDRSFISFERFLQSFTRWNVEVISGLVQYKYIHARVDQLRQRESPLLSAGQIAHVLIDVVAKEKKLCEKRPQFPGGRG